MRRYVYGTGVTPSARLRFDSATMAPDNATAAPVVDYPLAGAYMPRNVYPPNVMWTPRHPTPNALDVYRVRLVRPHAVVEGFRRANLRGVTLVVVGDAPYAREYIAELHRMAGPNVRFPGAIYGEGYRELQCHALAYVHATEVGGTHPALVEAMVESFRSDPRLAFFTHTAGGAVKRVDELATAFPHRQAETMLIVGSVWDDPARKWPAATEL